MDIFKEISLESILQPLARSGVVLILAGIGLWANKFLVNRIRAFLLSKETAGTEQSKRIETGMRVLQSVVVALITVIVIMQLMAQLGINLAPLLAAAGIGGLAVGFGAQSLIKDLIAGFFLLIENQIRIGDVVTIGGNGGLVESMGFRTLTLRDLSGSVHIIPNGSIDRVVNMTRDYSRYVFDVRVSYREDPDEVMAILQQLADELQDDPEYGPDILEPLEMLGVDSFEDSAVLIKCRIATKPIKQWRVGREFNRRLKKEFDKRGIEIPFPHRTIYLGDPKHTGPFPLHVVVHEGPGSKAIQNSASEAAGG
ncbi:MAG: mechanosensitive ion channel family protein [Deltaproteobacteria bacterium]|nr:mechanosensitive ion channel family protein [Deltaproteobacteria bacterium]